MVVNRPTRATRPRVVDRPTRATRPRVVDRPTRVDRHPARAASPRVVVVNPARATTTTITTSQIQRPPVGQWCPPIHLVIPVTIPRHPRTVLTRDAARAARPRMVVDRPARATRPRVVVDRPTTRVLLLQRQIRRLDLLPGQLVCRQCWCPHTPARRPRLVVQTPRVDRPTRAPRATRPRGVLVLRKVNRPTRVDRPRATTTRTTTTTRGVLVLRKVDPRATRPRGVLRKVDPRGVIQRADPRTRADPRGPQKAAIQRADPRTASTASTTRTTRCRDKTLINPKRKESG